MCSAFLPQGKIRIHLKSSEDLSLPGHVSLFSSQWVSSKRYEGDSLFSASLSYPCNFSVKDLANSETMNGGWSCWRAFFTVFATLPLWLILHSKFLSLFFARDCNQQQNIYISNSKKLAPFVSVWSRVSQNNFFLNFVSFFEPLVRTSSPSPRKKFQRYRPINDRQRTIWNFGLI